MNKFVIMAIAFASLAGIGVLGTIIVIEVQDLADFATLSELPDSVCSCPDVNGDFSPLNCEDFTGEIKDPNGLCKEIAPFENYGSPTLGGKGCGVDFWAAQTSPGTLSSTVWPSGYEPDYYYNDMFHTTLELSTLGLGDNKVKDDDDNVGGNSESTEESEVIDEEKIKSDLRPQPVAKDAERTITEDDETDQGPNLLQALQLSGENLNELIRESVAAILNSAHTEVDYPYSVSEIMSMTQEAIVDEDYNDTIKSFREVNDKNNSPICSRFISTPPP
ncbi:MAG: hypothetical protein O6761_04935 [Thaumarchaeota archaeon]|nr:hypothetical protein [Nitrososphaerota archaeon]